MNLPPAPLAQVDALCDVTQPAATARRRDVADAKLIAVSGDGWWLTLDEDG